MIVLISGNQLSKSTPSHLSHYSHNLAYFLVKSKSTHCHLLIPENGITIFHFKYGTKYVNMTLPFLPLHPSYVITFLSLIGSHVITLKNEMSLIQWSGVEIVSKWH